MCHLKRQSPTLGYHISLKAVKNDNGETTTWHGTNHNQLQSSWDL